MADNAGAARRRDCTYEDHGTLEGYWCTASCDRCYRHDCMTTAVG
jgi:hypothetical protein